MSSILLLEDDRDLALTIEELLQEQNYNVTTVFSAQEAIDATYDKEFDLYIFDINVPDMNGLDLLQSLRDADDTTPTIIISALVDLESIAQAFAVGAFDYLKKPFYPQELLIRVDAKLHQSQTQYIYYDELAYDPKNKKLYKDDELIVLGEVQECLCDLFFHNIGSVLDRSLLLDCLIHPSATALRVAINKLKQTTGLDIKNIRGVGYMLEKC